MDISCTFVRGRAFWKHPNIIEVICHHRVEKIEEWAFYYCPNLRRVIMPGVKIFEYGAFCNCKALTDVECGKLEVMKERALFGCKSSRGVNLPSARIVEYAAFDGCSALTDVKFGSKLERFDNCVFIRCTSLERITIPLKDGIITADDTFQECGNLVRVDLVEGEVHETIASLNLEDWINDMNREVNSINQILPNADAGYDVDFNDDDVDYGDPGEKARAIRTWIRSVLGKIVHYQAEHQRVLDDAATTLQLALPQDILMKNVLPFLELPPHTFEVRDHEDDADY